MKYTKHIVILALCIIGCCIGSQFIRDEGSGIDVPINATGSEIQVTCGSDYCTKLLSYTITINVQDLVQFYRERGYTCFERETHQNGPSPFVDTLPTPYWDCTKKSPKSFTSLGFREEPQSATIRLLISHGWTPAL